MKIVKMTQTLVAGVSGVEQECFTLPWSEAAFLETIGDERYETLVATADKTVFGFITCSYILDEGYLNNLAVTDAMRGKGVAKALLRAAIESGKKRRLQFLTLEVRVSNTPAICLYESFRFQKVAVRKAFYEKPTEDAYIMTLEFSDNMEEQQ